MLSNLQKVDLTKEKMWLQIMKIFFFTVQVHVESIA